ncbi:uncharacterized protein LOC144146266 [Haemaphysalis longicornis]
MEGGKSATSFAHPPGKEASPPSTSKSPPEDERVTANPEAVSPPRSAESPLSNKAKPQPVAASSALSPDSANRMSTPVPSATALPPGAMKKPQDKPANAMDHRRTLVIIEDSDAVAAKEKKASEPALTSPTANQTGSPDDLTTPMEVAVPAPMQRRASILRQPGTVPRISATSRVLGRRTSVVDFGAHEYASYVPGDVVTKPRIVPDASPPTMSMSVGQPRRGSISLRKGSRGESRTSTRWPPAANASVNEEMTRRDRQWQRRVDVHNAFLLGPALMIVLGSVSSYWTGPSFYAFQELAKTLAPEKKITAISWCVMTLPGSLLSVVLCFLYLSWASVQP